MSRSAVSTAHLPMAAHFTFVSLPSMPSSMFAGKQSARCAGCSLNTVPQNPLMHPAIAQHRTGIATICQRFHVSRLEVFGSAARADDFNPATARRCMQRDPHCWFV